MHALFIARLMKVKPSTMKSTPEWSIAHKSITSQIDGALQLTVGSQEYEIMKLQIDGCKTCTYKHFHAFIHTLFHANNRL